MAALESLNMTQPIRDFIASDRPFLGICLGLQMLFESSEESPGVPGLGVLKGSIARIPAGAGLKIPHIGWEFAFPAPDRRLVFRSGSRAVRIFCPLLLSARG